MVWEVVKLLLSVQFMIFVFSLIDHLKNKWYAEWHVKMIMQDKKCFIYRMIGQLAEDFKD